MGDDHLKRGKDIQATLVLINKKNGDKIIKTL